jgi:hypothetical protein
MVYSIQTASFESAIEQHARNTAGHWSCIPQQQLASCCAVFACKLSVSAICIMPPLKHKGVPLPWLHLPASFGLCLVAHSKVEVHVRWAPCCP